MMKKSLTLKLSCIALTAIFGAASLAGCGITKKPVGDKVDDTKTQLYVGNMYGGLRDNWLQAAKTRFEAAYAETSFEEGKKGVELHIDNNQFTGDNYLTSGFSDTQNEVFFTENVMYNEFVVRDMFADITDIVTSPLSEFGETKSIEDKMSDSYKNLFKTDSGKYYAIPFYEAYTGIAYDIDLFEEKGFFFAKGGCPSEYSTYTQANNADKATGSFTKYKYVGEIGDKSAGPDGKYGTSDDGLPATYEEFFVLCDYMGGKGVQPLVWPGASQDYMNEFAVQLWGDYEGVDKMSVNYTFDGKGVDIVTSFDTNGNPVITPTDIDNSNGYLMYNQVGRYYAISFIENIVKNGYYDPDSFGLEVSQMGAQEDFLYGRFSSKKRKVAMLVDGSWWQNEARDTYNVLVGEYGEAASQMNRRIGYMPLPKVSADKIGDESTYVSIKQTACFIKNGLESHTLEVAKKFVQFCHTDASLKEFTTIVNMPKPYEYEMTSADLAGCTLYGQDLYKAHATGNIVVTASNNDIYRAASTSFMAVNMWETSLNGLPQIHITKAFDNGQNNTAKDYFNGLLIIRSQSAWEKEFGKYF